MMKRIVYMNDGKLAVCIPVINTYPEPEQITEDEAVARAMAKLPATATDIRVLPESAIPASREHRSAWVYNADKSAVVADPSAVKAEVWEKIKAKRDALSEHGGYQAGGKWFHSDAKSKTQQLALAMMGAAVPPVQWKTMDGSFVAMTQTLAAQIFAAAAAQDMAIFAAAEAHKAAMEASPDPAAYDFSGGWPVVFSA
jgi:hypothetical protein